MKASLVLLTAVALLLAAAGASHLQAAPSRSQAASPFLPTPPGSGPRQIVIYGHVKSVKPKGARFEVRVDPAEYLSGETANRAAIEDKVIPPGDVVPNDHYIREDGHKLLTFKVPAKAHVTVVINNGGTAGFKAGSISVVELAQIVEGKNPKHRKLFEPRNAFWIRVASDTVISFDQQYSP
ncbi:MAG: hypothetical protein V7645_1027 [Actinomycetota bacterium]|jgi:hypothetical protein